ncbi:MAG TPA: tetratricopeptide repeat protein [Longimicrobium sp.]|nr:tetratricopeptide repeat protein [Longimicrobium sp.]
MNRPEATIEELLGLLPELDELEVLRLRLVAAAVRDPVKEWDSSSAYTTIDKRIVSPEAAERAIAEAEQALHEHVSVLHRGLRPFFESFFAGDRDAAARHLVALGEEMEGSGRAIMARRCYRAALTVSLPLPGKGSQVVALRRIGRVSLNVGDFHEAAAYYERSAELAHDSGDVHAAVVARTGLGNVLTWQGRWAEAEQCYHDALALADSADAGSLTLERGQIYNNLANLTSRLQRIEEAEGWFESAFRVWETLDSPVDLAICHHNHARLRETQERWDDARRSYEAALKLPVSSTIRAIVATDFAEWWLHEGYISQAEEWGRVAEEHAIASGSPYTLGHMYRGRGNLARTTGAVDGLTFYEKALEIARSKGYPLLEAETLLDYAALRAQNGGAEEAIAYLERASELFRDLGAVGEVARAQAALGELRPALLMPDVELAGESPLAAAAD